MASQPPAANNAATNRTRQVRKERYKRLLDDGSAIGESAETGDVFRTLNNLQDILQQSNTLVSDGDFRERMEDTSEVVLDAQVVKMSHELLGTALRTMDDDEFSEELFAQAIRGLVATPTTSTDSSASSDWQRLTDIAAPICLAFRWSQCMLGTFEATGPDASTEPKQRQQRQRTQTVQSTQQVRPEAIGAIRAKEKSTLVLNEILKQLMGIFERNGNQAIPYYGAVVDPLSFMNTVDNCFQVDRFWMVI